MLGGGTVSVSGAAVASRGVVGVPDWVASLGLWRCGVGSGAGAMAGLGADDGSGPAVSGPAGRVRGSATLPVATSRTVLETVSGTGGGAVRVGSGAARASGSAGGSTHRMSGGIGAAGDCAARVVIQPDPPCRALGPPPPDPVGGSGGRTAGGNR